MAPGLDSVKRHLDGGVFPASSSSDVPASAPKKSRSKLASAAASAAMAAPQSALTARVGAAAAKLPVRSDLEGSSDDQAISKAHAEAQLPPLTLDGPNGVPNLLESLPPLSWLNLPTDAQVRMKSRREWLQRLMQDELARTQREATTGAASAFESACGVPQSEPLPPPVAANRLAATVRKFEQERGQLVRTELLEIEALRAMQG